MNGGDAAVLYCFVFFYILFEWLTWWDQPSVILLQCGAIDAPGPTAGEERML